MGTSTLIYLVWQLPCFRRHVICFCPRIKGRENLTDLTSPWQKSPLITFDVGPFQFLWDYTVFQLKPQTVGFYCFRLYKILNPEGYHKLWLFSTNNKLQRATNLDFFSFLCKEHAVVGVGCVHIVTRGKVKSSSYHWVETQQIFLDDLLCSYSGNDKHLTKNVLDSLLSCTALFKR